MGKRARPYVFFSLIALGVGALSALLSRGGIATFDQVEKPPLTPPAILFPIVWTALYLLMGLGAADVWRKREEKPEETAAALTVWGFNLLVNGVWSILFFCYRAYFWSFLWLILLWVVIIVMILAFRRVSPRAAYGQIPYLVWVTFAGYLSLGVAILNA